MKVFPVAQSKGSSPSFSNDPNGRSIAITAAKGAPVVAVADGQLVRGKTVAHLHTNDIEKTVYVYIGIKPIGKDRDVTTGEVIGSIDKTERLNFEVRSTQKPGTTKPDVYGMLADAPSLTIPSTPWAALAVKYAGVAAAGLGIGYALSKVAFRVKKELRGGTVPRVSGATGKPATGGSADSAAPCSRRVRRVGPRDAVRTAEAGAASTTAAPDVRTGSASNDGVTAPAKNSAKKDTKSRNAKPRANRPSGS